LYVMVLGFFLSFDVFITMCLGVDLFVCIT
jgi:hypothetical protein